MLKFLNILMHIFHVGLIAFFLVGWIFPSLRSAHIVVSAVVLFSWFGIGLYVRKPGFCLATEIQYHIRRKLGLQLERGSYIVFLCEKIAGRTVTRWKAEAVTQCIFYVVVIANVYLKYGQG